MTHFDPISLPALLDCTNASRYREKTKKKLRRIAKKANGCVSLAAVQKDCRMMYYVARLALLYQRS